jgi:hypothetical protein
MTPLNLEVGMSASASSGANAGAGDFIIDGGGGSKTLWPWIILAGAGLVIFFVWFRRK